MWNIWIHRISQFSGIQHFFVNKIVSMNKKIFCTCIESDLSCFHLFLLFKSLTLFKVYPEIYQNPFLRSSKFNFIHFNSISKRWKNSPKYICVLLQRKIPSCHICRLSAWTQNVGMPPNIFITSMVASEPLNKKSWSTYCKLMIFWSTNGNAQISSCICLGQEIIFFSVVLRGKSTWKSMFKLFLDTGKEFAVIVCIGMNQDYHLLSVFFRWIYAYIYIIFWSTHCNDHISRCHSWKYRTNH